MLYFDVGGPLFFPRKRDLDVKGKVLERVVAGDKLRELKDKKQVKLKKEGIFFGVARKLSNIFDKLDF